ncbi:MAG: protein kinase [Verrucomicrobia bacterium]|nr:protein kinase [Verrucomicrobiota bacterium]
MNSVCALCQRPLPAGHAGGNCPACLFGSALSEETVAVPGGGPSEEVPGELGDYEILGEVGRGGTGVVYRARQRRLNRVVALKTLNSSALNNRDAFARLQTEAEAVARLDHPNIVPLYEVGRQAGMHFLVLRYFEHGSLAQALKQRRFTPVEAAQFLAQAARAVHHAHSRGVLHRDLKPSNFLLDADGAPHVADFGLAKLADSDSSLTLSTSVLGTPAYMAPEQASGNAKDAGTPADIYALGAILFELLTGRPPFLGKSALEVLRLVADAEPPRPTTLVPGLDRDLEAVCLRCLEKNPSRRYASAAALADDLERWLRNEPLSVRPLAPHERALKWVQRRPLVAGLTLAVTITVMTGVVSTVWGWQRAWAERAETVRLNYVASLQLAERHLDYGESSKARALLLAQPESERGWEWGRLMARAHDRLMRTNILTTSTNRVDAWRELRLEVSADGEWLAVTDREASEVRSATTGALLWKSPSTDDPVLQICFAPSGRQFLTVHRGPRLRFWSLPEGWEERTLTLETEPMAPGQDPVQVALHPDGQRFVTWSGAPAMQLRRLDTGTVEREFQPADPSVGWNGAAWFSPDGGRLLRKTAQPALVVWNTETGERLGLCPPPGNPLQSVVANPEGTHYATVDRKGVAALWRVGATAPEFQTAPDPPTADGRAIRAALPAPEHHRLVTVRDLGSVKFWDTGSGALVGQSDVPVFGWVLTPGGPLVTGGERGRFHVWDWTTGHSVRALANDGLIRSQFAVDRQARTLVAVGAAVTDQRFALAWPLAGDGPRVAPPEAVFRATFSPDGRRVATAHLDGQVAIWDAVTGERQKVLRGHFRWASAVAWGGAATTLFSSSADHTIRQWNPDTGELIRTLTLDAPVWSLATDRAGDLIAASVQSGSVVVYDTASGRLRYSWKLTPQFAAWAVRISPDGRWLAAFQASSQGGVWDLQSGRQVLNFDMSVGTPRVSTITGAFSPDGRTLATCSIAGELSLWETGTWRILARTPGGAAPADLCFSADGQRLFLTVMGDPSAGSDFNAVDVHDGTTGRRLARLSVTKGWSPSITMSGDGARLLRPVVDYGLRPRGFEVWPAFPWNDAAYAGEPGATIEERLESWAHRQLLRQRSRPGSQPAIPDAEPWVEPRSNWDPRSAETPASCLDLTSHYNGHLDRCAFANDEWIHELQNLGRLPRGVVRLDGVTWDVRGLITTGRPEVPRAFRFWNAGPTVSGIPVHQKARTLHMLQAAWHWAPEDVWGRYRLHYADGTTADLEIRAWYDVAYWTWSGVFAPDRPARIAWEGEFVGWNPKNLKPRLYHRAYLNPFPEKEIVRLDLLGGDSSAVPFVVAITLD